MKTKLITLLLSGLALSMAAASEPLTLRVMTFNIHHGEGIDGRLDLERIARVITDARADLVGLQEVDRGVERTQRRDLPTELARLTGLAVRFESNLPHQGGEYGNAVLSRFPVKTSRNTRFRAPRAGEQRGFQEVTVQVGGRELLFINTHLDFRSGDEERLASVDELRLAVTAAGSKPVIAAGDFNAVPGSAPILRLAEFLRDAWPAVGKGQGFTIPVRKPARRIDYLWYTPGALTPMSAAVISTNASDHLPVVVEFRLN
jgi:endonuclease/exonuclease/phosphatase family metal-dependent hydrolase